MSSLNYSCKACVPQLIQRNSYVPDIFVSLKYNTLFSFFVFIFYCKLVAIGLKVIIKDTNKKVAFIMSSVLYIRRKAKKIYIIMN